MTKFRNSRIKSVHLYNPKKEGVGSYDVNYINAYNKKTKLKKDIDKNHQSKERYAA
tara:strand:- start:9834 stop:10001 length:168 start_codon:yes stop_codon:yes gene_type:complete